MTGRVCLLAALFAALFTCPAYGREYFVSRNQPGASDTNPGTADKPFATISAAARVAGPGDCVTIGAGVYRESVILTRGGEPGKPVVYQTAPGADVLVKGSDVTTDWKRPKGYFVATVGNVWRRESPKLVGRADLFVFRREQVFRLNKRFRQPA